MTVQATTVQATARRWAADFRAALIAQESWRSQAACRSADPDLFFPISASGRAREQVAEAKAICAGCGVWRQCLAFAVQTHQLHGIWCGLTEQERGYSRQRSETRPQPARLDRPAGHERFDFALRLLLDHLAQQTAPRSTAI